MIARIALSLSRLALLVAVLGTFAPVFAPDLTPAFAAEITGAGASFPYPLYAKWADAYRDLTGVALNYQSIGSGGGVRQIKVGAVDFGATDMPLSAEELKRHGLVQWPMIMGGVAPIVNLEGVKPGQLTLSGEVLAAIYLGKIRKWNDPAIAALNPGLNLPKRAIAVVRRSDGSGTTFLFTHYLSRISPKWREAVGFNVAVEWPEGIGGKGNEGVSSLTAQTRGGVGYVEYAHARKGRLSYARMINREGRVVSPNLEAFRAAASNADWKATEGFNLILTDQPGEASWPITGASFILMRARQDNPELAKAALDFFDWCLASGGAMAEKLEYVPMPEDVARLIRAQWAEQMTGPDGRPLWPTK